MKELRENADALEASMKKEHRRLMAEEEARLAAKPTMRSSSCMGRKLLGIVCRTPFNWPPCPCFFVLLA